eukprot:m.283726 g.283726  ORF g.283726 m.283726 type:complete len:109 (+) comp19419_c2_seq5:195-521(+)
MALDLIRPSEMWFFFWRMWVQFLAAFLGFSLPSFAAFKPGRTIVAALVFAAGVRPTETLCGGTAPVSVLHCAGACVTRPSSCLAQHPCQQHPCQQHHGAAREALPCPV